MMAMQRMNKMMTCPTSAPAAGVCSFCAGSASSRNTYAMMMDATVLVASIFVISRISALVMNLGLISLSIIGLVLISLVISIIIKHKNRCRRCGI